MSDEVPTKKCRDPECEIPIKPITEFFKEKRNADGHSHICKVCKTRKIYAWREANRDQYNQVAKDFRAKEKADQAVLPAEQKKPKRVRKNNGLPCSAEDCPRLQSIKGYCVKHYNKLQKYNTLDPIAGTEEWKRKISDSHMSELAKIDPFKDPRSSHNGYYAVNIVNDIKAKALQRGKSWELTNTQAYFLIISACYYCKIVPDWPKGRNGIDRADNSKGYTVENCVPCCFICNSAKKELTQLEFAEWGEKFYRHFVIPTLSKKAA